MTRTCETCIHYFESDFNAFCKRYPPINDHTWPKVLKGHFCGEHQSRPKERQKLTRVPTTEAAKRIATLFGRKLTTEWNDREIRAFRNCGQIDLADLALVEKLYASGYQFKRTSLLTFLNNFLGEVDNAKAKLPKAKQAQSGDPEGWREWMESKGYPFCEYSKARGYMKEEFQKQRQLNSNDNTTKTETKQ